MVAILDFPLSIQSSVKKSKKLNLLFSRQNLSNRKEDSKINISMRVRRNSPIEVPFRGAVKSPKCVTFAPAKHNVKNSVPRTVR